MSDRLLNTARRLAGAAFEILGELGRSGNDRVAYLARESPTGELVAVTLDNVAQAETRGTDPSFSVRRALDPSVPAGGLTCPGCGSATPTWARFCPTCSHDLSGGPPPVEDVNTGRMLAQTAARGRYELLGDMRRSEGGSPVYFGRDETTGRLVALRLEPMDDPEAPVPFTLSVAQDIEAVAVPDETAGAAPPAADVSVDGADTGRIYVCPVCETQYPPGTFFCPRDGTALRPKTRTKDLVGRTIADRYRVLERLGQGGMGQVYKAVHVRMGSHCAIKIMNPALETDPEALGRFAREATLASRIEHANVARVYDFGETKDGLLFLAMEFVEGRSLSEIIVEEGGLEPVRAAELAWQVADALVAAHDMGTVHRDIKPDNIIVNMSRGGRETATVVDFGIAKGIDVSEDEQVTRAGFVVGNPKYMSPEQLIGETTDARGDIYSLGCVLYEMLVGASAFSGASGAALLTQRLTEPAPSPRAKVPSVPEALDAIVTRALAREREDRYTSALEMRDALDDFIAGAVTSPRRVSTDRQRAVKREVAEVVKTPPPPAKEAPAPPQEPTPPPAEETAPSPPSIEARRPASKSTPRASSGTAIPGRTRSHARRSAVQPPGGDEKTVRESGGATRRGRSRPGRRLIAAAGVFIVVIVIAIFWPRGVTPVTGTVSIQGRLPLGAAITARDADGNTRRIEGASVQLAVGPWDLFFVAPGSEPDSTHIQIESGGVVRWTPRIRSSIALPVEEPGEINALAAGGQAGGESVELGRRDTVPPERPVPAGISDENTRTDRPTAPTRIPADSAAALENLISQARSQAGQEQYDAALATLDLVAGRMGAMRFTYVDASALDEFDDQIGQLRRRWTELRDRPPLLPNVDSIRIWLSVAATRRGRDEYAQAYEYLDRARSRLQLLQSYFQAAAEVVSLADSLREAEAATKNRCEAVRKVRLDRGEPPPVCR